MKTNSTREYLLTLGLFLAACVVSFLLGRMTLQSEAIQHGYAVLTEESFVGPYGFEWKESDAN